MKTLLLFLSLIVATSQAATVRLYFTDPLTNEKDTNAFYITPVGTNVLSNGGVVGRGVTTRYVPASNGYRTNTLAVGHYSITNRSLGSGVVIRVPETSSLYDYTNLLISGYNTFVTINNYTNSNSGAAVSNVFGLTFALDTRYTNSTAYYAQISSSMTFTQQNSSDSAFYFFIDTNLDGTIDFRRTNWFHVNSGTTWSKTTFTETVPPGAAYGATNISNGTSTMTADALSGAIIYFSTNSASGTVQTNISYAAVTNLTSFGALTNNDTRGITFLNGLTVQNNLEVSSISSGAGNLSLSPEASGNVVISVGQLVGNGGGLTNLTGSGSSIAAGTNIVTVTNGALVTVHGTANVTQAGLAAGSYAVNGVLATNLVDAVGAYSPQHFNIGKTPVMDGLIRSNFPVRMLVFGDDAFVPTTGIIAAFTNMGFAINGTGGGSTYANGNYAYSVSAGTTTYDSTEGVSNPNVIATYGMANGSSLTNVVALGQNQGIDTDRIAIKYWKNTGFGTLQVFTNSYGNTPVLCKTLDANVGSFSFAITNFDVARISNCVVSIVSSGTNFVLSAAIGQWKTNGQILRLDQYTGGNLAIESFTSTASRSNLFRTLLTDFDVLVVSDLGGGFGYTPITNLWGMINDNNLALDVVLSTSIIQSNNQAYDSRMVSLGAGKYTPFVVVDTAAFLAPTNKNTLASFYESSNPSHLSTAGNAYVGSKFVNALGWNEEGFRTTIKQPQTNYVFLGVDRLRNDSGALTMTHLYSTLGTTFRTWGHYVAAGTYGANASIFYPGNELGQRKNMYARMLVLTTNVISYNLALNQYAFPLGTNITSFTAASGETGNYTLGASGQTNISYTEWVSIKPTVKGPWGGWVIFGYGATSKAYASFVLGVELRSDPDNAWDNW